MEGISSPLCRLRFPHKNFPGEPLEKGARHDITIQQEPGCDGDVRDKIRCQQWPVCTSILKKSLVAIGRI